MYNEGIGHIYKVLSYRQEEVLFVPVAALTGRFPSCSTKLGDSGHLSHAKCQGREMQGPGEMEHYASVDTAGVPSLT